MRAGRVYRAGAGSAGRREVPRVLARLLSTLSALSAATASAGLPPDLEGASSDSTAPALQTGAQRIVGTRACLCPEAIALAAPSPSFDLWDLAVTLYEALTRRNPFLAATVGETVSLIEKAAVPDPRDLRPDCPAPLAERLASALSVDPGRRPQSALELGSRLQAVARASG